MVSGQVTISDTGTSVVPIHWVCLIFTVTDVLWDVLRVKEKSTKRIEASNELITRSVLLS